MQLEKEHWSKEDIADFYCYQKTLIGNQKDSMWEQGIVNTKLKCFGKTSSKAKEISNRIKRGNYLEFLDQLKIKTHFDSLLVAHLLNNIKDFNIYKKYLNKYIITIDNWASVDTLKFNHFTNEELYPLAIKYLKSSKEFVRRLGVDIFFELIKDNNYLKKAFTMLDSLYNESKYYVNMAASWLLADLLARNRDLTLEYFKNNHTNDFIINKAISKSRDSYRINKIDKEQLLKYKR